MSRHFIKASFLLITALTIKSFCFDAKTGDTWINGDFSLLSSKAKPKFQNSISNQDSRRTYQLSLSSAMRYFLIDHICLGPRFTWRGFSYVDANSYDSVKFINFFELNGELGYVRVLNNSYPYLMVSPGVEFNQDYSRFVLPFSAGLMLKITEHLGLQFELGLKIAFEEAYTINTVGIGIGICGFGKNSAISILNQFQPY
jgi:hypothetical protein